MRKHLPITELTEADLERFWSRIDVRGPDECWEWKGSTTKGYGQISKGRPRYLATRWAYFIKHGIDPGDKSVCHTCDNPPCCNPAHLWLGTHQENQTDSKKKGRRPQGEQNGRAQLTEDEVHKIFTSDEYQRILADRYDVSRQHISNIKLGKRWKHLEINQ